MKIKNIQIDFIYFQEVEYKSILKLLGLAQKTDFFETSNRNLINFSKEIIE